MMQFCKHGVPLGVCTLCDKHNLKPQWQELTDVEIQEMWKFYDGKWYDFATAIGSKLKEKNT